MMVEVKVCENCQHSNPVTAVECEKCGYDLTFVFPQKMEELDGQPEVLGDEQIASRETTLMSSESIGGKWSLAFLADEEDVEVVDEEVSVGRDCALFSNRFNSSNYTSRIHAKIRVMDGKLQIMDASTNGTFIDDIRIPKMEWTEVKEGGVIRFADISFVVRKN